MAASFASNDPDGWADVRICLAALLAPTIPLLIACGLVWLSAGGKEWGSLKFFPLFYLPTSYMAVLFIGIPLALFLRRRKRFSIALLAAAGGLSAHFVWLVFKIVFAVLLGVAPSIQWSWMDSVWAVGFGVSVALPFAWIAGAPLLNPGR